MTRTQVAIVLSGLIAALGIFAISVEAAISFRSSFREGRGIAEALYLFLRFFTILTNIAIVVMMLASLRGLVGNRPLPPATLHGASLVYVTVVGVTYEALLRDLWSPHGTQFVTDMIMHDIMPMLSLAFWIFFAPKAPLSAWDPLRWLAFPLAYFAMTIAAGQAGEGYPYHFLNADEIGLPGMIRNALVFLVFFYGLGLAVKAGAGRLAARDATPF